MTKKKLFKTNLIFFTVSPLVGIVGGIFYATYFHVTWVAPVLFVLFFAVTMMSISAGLHRLYSHRTHECASWLKFLYLVFGAASFEESCLNWATDHRIHHKFVDTPKDPYNIKEGFWWAHMGWILYYNPEPRDYPKDLTDDKLVMWQHNHWIFIGCVAGFALPTFIGALFGDPLGGFLFGGVLRMVAVHHFTWTINSLAHTIGTQPYSNQNTARDSWITAIFTFGEGYHNFHHWYARDYRNGMRYYHWDPPKWFIRAMESIGQTWNLRRAPFEAIAKARLEMDRKRIEAHGPDFSHRMNELLEKLTRELDDLSVRRRAWMEAKRASSAHSLHEHIATLQANFKETQRRYHEAYRDWRAYIREVSRAHVAAARP